MHNTVGRKVSLKQGSKLEGTLWTRLSARWKQTLRSDWVRLMADERIHVLRDILLELHNGASPESVQESFDATLQVFQPSRFPSWSTSWWTRTRASLLKMSWNSAMSMPIFLKMLLKVSSRGYRTPWPPSSAFSGWKSGPPCGLDSHSEIVRYLWIYGRRGNAGGDAQGLGASDGTCGQFDIHYQRKEELFFPIMERYGHDSPPKVMWELMIRSGDSFKQL